MQVIQTYTYLAPSSLKMSRKIIPTFTATCLPRNEPNRSVASGSGTSVRDGIQLLSNRKDTPKGKSSKGKERQHKAASNTIGTIGKHRSKDSSTLMETILRELRSLKSDVAYIRSQLEQGDSSIVDIGSSHYKGPLQTALAKSFVKSLTREVTNETIQLILQETLSQAHFNSAAVYQRAMRWCSTTLTTFRTNERRKVIGINPYEMYPKKSTSDLARNILNRMAAPRDSETTNTYTAHLNLLRHYVQKYPKTSSEKGNLYSNFSSWVLEEFGEIPNIREISAYLHDSSSSSGSETTLDSQQSIRSGSED